MSKKSRVQNKFLEELKKLPIVLIACQKSGVSRNSIYRWKKEDKSFSESMEKALAEGEALINDMTESQLLTLIKEKKWSAISFWLRHRNPRFRDKLEITSKNDDSGELTPAQTKVVNHALELANILPTNVNQDEKRQNNSTKSCESNDKR